MNRGKIVKERFFPLEFFYLFFSLSFALNNRVLFRLIAEKKKLRVDTVDCTPPDYIMPGCRERPLLALHPLPKDHKGPQCIKVRVLKGTLAFFFVKIDRLLDGYLWNNSRFRA